MQSENDAMRQVRLKMLWLGLPVLSMVGILVTVVSCSDSQPEQNSQTAQIDSNAQHENANQESSLDSSELKGNQVAVALIEKSAKQKRSRSRSFSAVTKGLQEAKLTVKRPGRIVGVEVSLGEIVEKGQVLVRLDSALEILAVEGAKAKNISTAAAAEKANLDFNRAKELFVESGISKSRLENIRLAAEIAQATAVGAKAELGVALRQLSETKISAPFAGEISHLPYDIGETPSMIGVVAEITDRRNLIAEIYLSAEESDLITAGMTASVSLGANSKVIKSGKLRAISPKANPITKLFMGEVIFDNKDLHLRSGVSCRISFNLSDAIHPIIPSSAIIYFSANSPQNRSDSEAVIAIVTNESDVAGSNDATILRVEFRRVEIGGTVGSGISILSGLKFGESIVVLGAETLSDGQILRSFAEVSLDSLLY